MKKSTKNILKTVKEIVKKGQGKYTKVSTYRFASKRLAWNKTFTIWKRPTNTSTIIHGSISWFFALSEHKALEKANNRST